MNRPLASPRCDVKSLYLSLLVVSCLAIASPGIAQWPTNYQDPKILGGGTETRAAAVMATTAGGAMVVFDDFEGGVRQATTRHFNITGEQLFTNIYLHQNTQFAISFQLLGSDSPTIACKLYAYFAKPDLDDHVPTYVLQYVDTYGEWLSISPAFSRHLQGVISTQDGLAATVYTNPQAGEIGYQVGGNSETKPINSGERVLDFSLASIRDSHLLFSYTRRGQQPGCPSEVWTGGGRDVSGTFGSFALRPAHDDTGQEQFNSCLTELSTDNLMLSWLQTLDGVNSLHVKSISYSGVELSTPRETVENVVDYVATSSTLGLPVFAAVQRDNTAAAPMDTLMGGLINPGNGGTLTIPVATGPDVKVKDLRQVANGDFRLAYSTLEGGTNLLKVRGISGITGGTLWEATVADLGRGSDEIVDTYPNTFVESNGDSVLYILARYDQPGTANSLFQMVRLRADGTMGGE